MLPQNIINVTFTSDSHTILFGDSVCQMSAESHKMKAYFHPI